MKLWIIFPLHLKEMFIFYSMSVFYTYAKQLSKPLGNRCLVDMQELVPFLIHFHLCRDVIGKCIAPVLV